MRRWGIDPTSLSHFAADICKEISDDINENKVIVKPTQGDKISNSTTDKEAQNTIPKYRNIIIQGMPVSLENDPAFRSGRAIANGFIEFNQDFAGLYTQTHQMVCSILIQ